MGWKGPCYTIVCAALTVAIVVAVRQAPELDPVPARSEAIYVTPAVVSNDLLQSVDIELTWSEPIVFYWPGSEGKLTSVLIGPGSTIATGDIVATVDGRGIIAISTAEPFYRDLVPGSRGADVDMLVLALKKLNLLASDEQPETYTRSVSQAVRELNSTRGVDSNQLTVADTVWIASNNAPPLESVDLVPGSFAPEPGGALATTKPELAAVSVNPVGGSGTLSKPPKGQRSTATWELDLPAVEDTGLLLNGSLEATDFEKLASFLTGDTEKIEKAEIRLVEPLTSSRIPASAVASDLEGRTCVFDSEMRPVLVEILTGSPGRIDTSSDVPSRVVANPYDLAFEISCQD